MPGLISTLVGRVVRPEPKVKGRETRPPILPPSSPEGGPVGAEMTERMEDGERVTSCLTSRVKKATTVRRKPPFTRSLLVTLVSPDP